MMRVLLGVLYLSGQCHVWRRWPVSSYCVMVITVFLLSGWLVFSSSLIRQYFLISSLKTWHQAQTYCRQNYTDLVTFENAEEVQLMASFSSAANLSDVWIGLICHYDDFWSPSFNGSTVTWWNHIMAKTLFVYHFCGSISKNGFGYDHWSVRKPFICSNGEFSQSLTLNFPAVDTFLWPLPPSTAGTQLVFVNNTMDWFSAWTYCRENFTDLTAPPGPLSNDSQDGAWYSDVLSFVPSGYQAWIGLNKYPFTFWSDGSSSSFRYWDNLQAPSSWVPRLYAVANFNRSERWRFVPDGEKLPFICLNVSEDQVAETELGNKKGAFRGWRWEHGDTRLTLFLSVLLSA